jgi:hypothetical protein
LEADDIIIWLEQNEPILIEGLDGYGCTGFTIKNELEILKNSTIELKLEGK